MAETRQVAGLVSNGRQEAMTMKILASRGQSYISIRIPAPLLIFLLIVGAALASGFAFAADGRSFPVDPKLYQALRWRNVGPFRAGRTTAVAGHADRPMTFYLGASGGGVWKTTDAGTTWHNVSDGFFHVGGIGAIRVAPSDPNVIYVGTGEASVRGQTTSPGDGIYRSDDSGKTWVHLGLVDTRHIAAIEVDPHDPDTVFVAAQGNPWMPSKQRGVYRSRDGGKTWQQVLFVNDTAGAHDLSIDPNNPRVLYAAMWDYRHRPWTVRSGGPGSGLWKSTDGGDTWRRLSQGLPKLMGNTAVSVSPVDPDRVYAMIEAVHGGVFRSDDAGQSWRRVNGDAGIRDRGWYYTRIFADPVQEDTVFVLANSLVKSTDGGTIFGQIRNPHGDNHALWINPRNDKIMVEGSDGGAVVTLNGGQTWSSDLNQPTGQFYRVFADNAFPYRIYGGQQDWGTVSLASRSQHNGIGPRDWHDIGGGESAQVSMDPDHPDLVYATGILGSITEYDQRTAAVRDIQPYPYFAGFRPPKELKYRFNWSPPVLVSRYDPKVIYLGAQALLESTDRGLTWQAASPDLTRHDISKEGTDGGPISIEGAGGETYGTITYIAESPQATGTLWVGSDDGLVHLTRDGGKTWMNVTPPGMNEAQVEAIEASPHAPARAYVAASRYEFGDFTPMIYRTDDYGHSWRRIVEGIPAQAFVRVVREDPERSGLLYAGTEAGLFISFNDGKDWQPFQLNLPLVPVTDLKVRDNDLIASTEGRGYWILDDLTPLHQLDAEVAQADMYLFKPRRTYRLDNYGGLPQPGRNPPDGVIIRYEFAKVPDTASHPVVLEIVDGRNHVIRSFTSAVAESEAPSLVKGVEKLPPPPPVPAQAGMNTYVWDLRVAPYTPVADTIRYVSQLPYRVAPGIYRVRLSYGGKSQTQSFEVVNDPRHGSRPASEWSEQQQLLSSLRALVDDIHRSTNQLRSVAQQADELMHLTAGNAQAGNIRSAGRALIARIARWEEQVPQPELPNHVQDYVSAPSRLLSTPVLNLISVVDQDPPVTAAAKAQAQALEARWSTIQADRHAIEQGELARFNASLSQAGIPNDIVPTGTDRTPPRVIAPENAMPGDAARLHRR
ncbi:MAG: glycosyl hydrolase [Gammaproteobacteria bacterium]|nr:glycosyl hydrolase [Gammaproteobacteria bacterium]